VAKAEAAVKRAAGKFPSGGGLAPEFVTTEGPRVRMPVPEPPPISNQNIQSRANGFPNQRIPASDGRWTGPVGNSGWVSDLAEVQAITNGKPVPFKDGFPVFKEWALGEVKLSKMKGNRTTDFRDADALFAEQKGWLKDGVPDIKKVEQFREAEKLTWHHLEDKSTMQLVPQALNNRIPHTGGASLVKRGSYE
jgi:hypothetical protein